MAARQAQEADPGTKAKGKAPKPPEGGPRADDPINLTDAESRIMPDGGGGFEQSYNAQALVDTESLRVRVAHVTQATHDKQPIQPMLEQIPSLPAGRNSPETLVADTGYYSENHVKACQDAEMEPLIAVKREAHPPHWKERFSEPQPLRQGAPPVETMKHRLKTRAGKARYALRKQTVEPVFGLIKSVMGFRQFLLRGLENVRHEWTRVCLAWNLKRMAVLRP